MSKYSVMIVDDNEADRYILKRYLNKANIVDKIFEANDGKEALSFFEAHEENKAKHTKDYPPSILFLDVNMPLIDGFEFLEKFNTIRQKVGAESVVIMMFSSSGRQEEKDRALAFPFVKDYLIKGNLKNVDFIKTLGSHSPK